MFDERGNTEGRVKTLLFCAPTRARASIRASRSGWHENKRAPAVGLGELQPNGQRSPHATPPGGETSGGELRP